MILPPAKRTWVSCAAGYGEGGLGGHLAAAVEWCRARGELAGYIARRAAPGDETIAHPVSNPRALWLATRPPLRWLPGWRNLWVAEAFDRSAAKIIRQTDPTQLPDRLIAFGGQARRTFTAARQRGVRDLWLIAANSHVDHVRQQHRAARQRHRIEASWLNAAQAAKTRREYALADRVLAASGYTRRALIAHGVNPDKILRLHYPVADSYRPASSRPDDDSFRVVFLGSATVMKGLPILVEAFARADLGPQAELTVVGGPASRGGRRYLDTACRADPRIRVAPGDPRPHLHRADVLAHPTWEDGWAYAPVEALACGVPVIVSTDTGMAEILRDETDGCVVPTGDVDALALALRQARDRRRRVTPPDTLWDPPRVEAFSASTEEAAGA